MEQAVDISLTDGWIFSFEGTVDSHIIARALDATLNYYPKFKCTLVKHYPSLKRWFRYCWEYHQDIGGADILDEIEETETDPDQDVLSYYRRFHPSHRIDLTREVPLKVLLIRQPKHTVIIFYFHHSVTDGIGFNLFIRKLFQFYEEILGGQTPVDDADPDFKSISQPEITAPWRNVSLRECVSYWRETLFRRKPAVQVHCPGGEGSWGTAMAVGREILPHQFNQLKSAAKANRVSLNDYLLSAMFQAINQWNGWYGAKRGRFYINVPVNLRPPGEFTIGNIFCWFDISASSEVITDKKKLLTHIRGKSAFLRNNNIAKTTLHASWYCKLLPIKLKDFIFRHHPHGIIYPSLGLSNLGVCEFNPSHKDEEGFHYMGAARINSIFVVNSAIPWPQVVIVSYNDRMTVTLVAFHSHFSLEAAEKLLDCFVEKLIE